VIDSELRYRTLIEQLPVVTYIDALDDRSSNIYTSPQIEPVLGYAVDEWQTDGDLFVRILHPDDRERVLAAIREANATGERFECEYRLLARDGRVVWFRDECVVVRDGSGAPLYSQGFLVDITDRKQTESERKRAERRLAAQHAVTRALAECATLGEAAPRILEEVCGALDWELGGLWTIDEELQRLRLVSVWHAGDRRFDRFVDESWSLVLDRGEGFPGAVWETGEVRWFADVAGSSRSRTAGVAAAGLHGALATPIVGGGEVLGVLELFSTRVWEPDDDLLAMLASVGSQVGQFSRRVQADRDVREREERFRTLVANLPGAIYRRATDQDRTMSFLSDAIREITGYPASDFIDSRARTYSSVIHPDDQAVVDQLVGGAIRGKEPFELEYRTVHADGSVRWVAERGQPIIGPGGAVLWLDGAIFDVTEQKAAETALAKERDLMRLFLEATPDHVYFKDLESRFLRISSSFARWLELEDVSQALGKTDLDYFTEEHAARSLADEHEVLRTGRPMLNMEEREPWPNGSETWVVTSRLPLRDEHGEIVGTVGVSRDITEQKLAAVELERLLEQLEEQNEQLRALDRMKDEFVALVSHELRTPLTSILGYLELVLDGEVGEVPDVQARFLGIIERNAQRLLRLVGDLLFVAQIEAGKLVLEHEPCDLRELASDCIEAARPRATEKEIELTLEVETPAELQGDRTRIAQLLDNLVSNAIKFTPEGGRVGVRLTRCEGRVLVDVSDTGIGIAPEEQEHLFERFFRTSETKRHAIQGTGLGLTITKAIVEAHGGSIEVESEPGIGTTVIVGLPLEPALSSAHEPVPTEEGRDRL